jgi:hypothetical protein
MLNASVLLDLLDLVLAHQAVSPHPVVVAVQVVGV